MSRFSLVVVVALVAATAPVTATAGTYTHYACSLPSGETAPTESFVAFGQNADTHVSNECGEPSGLLGAVADGAPAGTAVGWVYTAPPELPVVKVRALRTVFGPSPTSSVEYQLRSTSDQCDASTSCPHGDVETTWEGPPMAALEFVVSCPELACAADEPPWQFVGADKASVGGFLLKSIAITHRDNAAPQFSQNPSGSLFEAGGVVSGLAAGRFEAVDSGSGIHRIRLVVDGVEMPVEQLNSLTACAEPFVSATPCPPIVASEFSFDTARLPDGLHTVQLEAFDATGTSPAVYGPMQIRVENFNASGQAVAASGLVPNGSGASRSAKLRGIGRSSRSLRRQKSDRPSTVIGRLVNDKGAPISGAALRVFAAVDVPGAKPKLMAGATTGRTGRFSFEIPPGASRRVDVRYRAFSTDDKDAASWQFRVAVPAPVKLMSSRPQLLNTQKLTLTAHLSGARIPARSADAAFQVRIGKTWRTFATRPFNEQGLARVGHRFRVTFHRLTYRFRVLTLRRRTFPFANAHSRPVAVQVN